MKEIHILYRINLTIILIRFVLMEQEPQEEEMDVLYVGYILQNNH